MKFLNKILITFSVLCILAFVNSAQARVLSIGASHKVVIDGESFNSVRITCDTKTDRPRLLKNDKERQWCDSVVSQACYSKKMKAAQYVCSAADKRSVKDLNVASTESTESTEQLLAELRSIEDALLEIQERRLELRLKEQTLRRQSNRTEDRLGDIYVYSE